MSCKAVRLIRKPKQLKQQRRRQAWDQQDKQAERQTLPLPDPPTLKRDG